jgi:hypothetical protein
MSRLITGFSRRAVQLLIVAILGMWALPASAGGLSPKDQKQIIEVVQAQLNAFVQDDAAKAFSYAAPNIRHLVGTAESFLEMVRTQYEIVYRPSSTTFMQPNGEAGEAVLKVRMTDEDGDAWIATYTLQRQKNKTWKITGCAVNEATGTAV